MIRIRSINKCKETPTWTWKPSVVLHETFPMFVHWMPSVQDQWYAYLNSENRLWIVLVPDMGCRFGSQQGLGCDACWSFGSQLGKAVEMGSFLWSMAGEWPLRRRCGPWIDAVTWAPQMQPHGKALTGLFAAAGGATMWLLRSQVVTRSELLLVTF